MPQERPDLLTAVQHQQSHADVRLFLRQLKLLLCRGIRRAFVGQPLFQSGIGVRDIGSVAAIDVGNQFALGGAAFLVLEESGQRRQ